MDSEYAGFIEELLKKPEFQCPVCGKGRYVTDHGNHEVTIHCSSSDAKFWEFDTREQTFSVVLSNMMRLSPRSVLY